MTASVFALAKRRSLELAGVGLGLRWEFLDDFLALEDRPVRFVEVSPENYLGRGGFYRRALDEIARRVPVVSHGLTLSLGGAAEPDPAYLAALHRELCRIGARWHSDHVSFSSAGTDMLHELVPVPQTRACARRIARRVAAVQQRLGLPTCVEHVTWYCQWARPEMDEAAFLREIVERSDCGLLLDVNNVYVNAENHGFDPLGFVRELPLERVVELHVAGHHRREDGWLLDTHGAPVCERVLELLSEVLELTGPVPVLLERDGNVPELPELLAEVRTIERVYARAEARRRGRSKRPPASTSPRRRIVPERVPFRSEVEP